MKSVSKVFTDLMEFPPSHTVGAYPAGVTKGLQLVVKWGLEGVSASPTWLVKTVIAVLMDTITTHSASRIQYIRRPPNPPQDLLWYPPAPRVISAHQDVSPVDVTTEGQCNRCVTL